MEWTHLFRSGAPCFMKLGSWHRRALIFLALGLVLLVHGPVNGAQPSGTLRGRVLLRPANTPAHGMTVTLVPGNRSSVTDEAGRYEFSEIPPGRYTVIVHMERLPDVIQTVEIGPGATVTLDIEFTLSPIREQITVTASGREETLAEAFHAVTSLDATDLLGKDLTSLGQALEHQPGVAKRSFGPGSSRPVIRGFDGDRVLILQDGIRTGSLSSQSGEHGEPLDVLSADTIEVVKGPATLLYGSNALGGVINVITRHHQMHQHPHRGARGYVTGIGSSTNDHGGGSLGLEYGFGDWLIWGNGGGQRTRDYRTPLGRIPNSETRGGHGTGGFGRYGERTFFSLSYGHDVFRYGVPFAGQLHAEHDDHGEEDEHHEHEAEPRVDLKMRRHNLRASGGVRDLGAFVDRMQVFFDYTDYQHRELEDSVPKTTFENRQVVSRIVFDERKRGGLSGSFGFWFLHRRYETRGEETLAPPVTQRALALFALQQWDLRRLVLQFGGRLEHNGYDPVGLPSRSFTGFSGAAGLRLSLWEGGTFVLNYTHSFRAPALEELYNRGPHIGNLAFEIGDPMLRRERGDGVDLSVRHQSDRWRAEANAYYYRLTDFVFPAPTGEIREGLRVVVFRQADSRFIGTELGLNLALHQRVWLNLGLDAVDAELRPSRTPLPRIPPVRGRAGLDIQIKDFTLAPEAILARAQNDIFPTETRTPGYAVFNVRATYTLAQSHMLHIFSITGFNLGNRLYRNHLSFIKDLAPEIGRGVRFAYTLRLF
ncbi:MAG: TonB-dependent receptor [Blastocatellia bacterium]|nr:TonB-dependent receptor [Blastocatellia bacterium]MCS7158440.1 TonB-dependent receptor [Blastocatellia bacterium]MCX7753488.1 TonB-dependent receptor [Blastocatellia bacterium]MDW8167879.1 TonB-dependent receptor [Acidobacteriota bacterium]MDW8255913.1 TonB-dependent receptor [Acidobacteriota bacterium]